MTNQLLFLQPAVDPVLHGVWREIGDRLSAAEDVTTSRATITLTGLQAASRPPSHGQAAPGQGRAPPLRLTGERSGLERGWEAWLCPALGTDREREPKRGALLTEG
ncbi:hypothetical protein PAMP_003555 [Pampus punctatissimus]